jgi:hypothetical protein
VGRSVVYSTQGLGGHVRMLVAEQLQGALARDHHHGAYPEGVTAYLKHKRSVETSTQGLGGHVRMLVAEQLTSPAWLQPLQRQYFGAKECTVQHVERFATPWYNPISHDYIFSDN